MLMIIIGFLFQNSEESSYSTPQQLKQLFIIVPSKLRLVALATFLLWKNKVTQRSIFRMLKQDA